MNDNEFYGLAWKVVAFVLVALFLTIGGCEAHRDAKTAEMVANGADPLYAYCAVRGSSQDQMCAVLATKRD